MSQKITFNTSKNPQYTTYHLPISSTQNATSVNFSQQPVTYSTQNRTTSANINFGTNPQNAVTTTSYGVGNVANVSSTNAANYGVATSTVQNTGNLGYQTTSGKYSINKVRHQQPVTTTT